MLVKRIAECTHLSSIVYELQRDIGRKLQLFPTPLHLAPLLGVFPLEFREKVWIGIGIVGFNVPIDTL